MAMLGKVILITDGGAVRGASPWLAPRMPDVLELMMSRANRKMEQQA